MRDFANAHPGKIAEATLEEIPGQVCVVGGAQLQS